MALDQFWNDVRERNPLFREGLSPPDVPRTDAGELDTALTERQEAWRPRGALKGYDEKDFDFLPSAARDRLTDLVARVNATAAELRELWYRFRSDADAEELFAERVPLGRLPLRDIILILEQDRYRTPDALRYGKLVEQEFGDTLPEGVVELRFESGPNSWGEPALRVWALLSDESTATDESLVKVGRHARAAIRAALTAAVPDCLAYISFRGISERVEEEEEAAA